MSVARDFRFNGVVRLTKLGSGYLVFALIVGFAALNTGNNPLYLGLAFMLAALILSGIASKSGLKKLKVEVRHIEDAWVGKPVRSILRVANRSRIWNVRDLIIALPDQSGSVYIPLIRRRSAQDVDALFVFDHRGRVTLSSVDLYTRYPFGLFVKKRRVRVGGEAIVFPRLLDHPIDPRVFSKRLGDAGPSNQVGLGTEVFAFREYVRGDSIKQVHWKKSAGLGRWVMKQMERETTHIIAIAVDPFLPATSSEAEFELMVSRAATYVWQALDGGFEVDLHLPGLIRHANDLGTAKPLFEALALVEATSEPVAFHPSETMVVFSLRRFHEARSA